MLSKNKIDKKLRNYIKEHLGKGYTKHAVKHVLVNHGYDELYIDSLLRRQSELESVKKYAVIVSLLFILSIFSFNILPTKKQTQITAYVVDENIANQGCCVSICQQTIEQECDSKFIQNQTCSELEECNVGCCIDKEGYCLTNYLYGNCIERNGTHVNRDCSEIFSCRNITNSYGINQKVVGIATVEPISDYYGSSFNVKYYLYDKTNILSVEANIKDSSQIIDAITLYDDGSHNDGVNNDNLYGNNWISSGISEFEGFKSLNIDIIVKYNDDTQQSIINAQTIVLLSNNKCLPIYTQWTNSSEKQSIIFAANNYESLSDGYGQFEADTDNFLNLLFSISPFLNNQNNFNVYRLENSLSYSDTSALLNDISASCPYYNNEKDLVLLLDKNELYCIPQGANFARVNPQVLLYNNISNSGINEIFADFCSYVLTPQMLANQILNIATPPTISVFTLDNVTYYESTLNLSFSVSSINYPVNYSIFLDGSSIYNIISNNEINDSIMLTLANGTNQILIEAIDAYKNYAFAQLSLNTITQ